MIQKLRPKPPQEAIAASPARAGRTGSLWSPVAFGVLIALLLFGVVRHWIQVETVSLQELSSLSGIEFPASTTVVASRYEHSMGASALLSAVVMLGGHDADEWTADLTLTGKWEKGPEYDRCAADVARLDPLLQQYAGLLVGKRVSVLMMQLPREYQAEPLGNTRTIVVVPRDGLALVVAN